MNSTQFYDNLISAYKDGLICLNENGVLPCSWSEQIVVALVTDDLHLLGRNNPIFLYRTRLNDEQRRVVDQYLGISNR